MDDIRRHRFTEEYRDILFSKILGEIKRMRKQCIPGLPPAIEGLGTRLGYCKTNIMDIDTQEPEDHLGAVTQPYVMYSLAGQTFSVDRARGKECLVTIAMAQRNSKM